jgi:hypothetical protein
MNALNKWIREKIWENTHKSVEMKGQYKVITDTEIKNGRIRAQIT